MVAIVSRFIGEESASPRKTADPSLRYDSR